MSHIGPRESAQKKGKRQKGRCGKVAPKCRTVPPCWGTILYFKNENRYNFAKLICIPQNVSKMSFARFENFFRHLWAFFGFSPKKTPFGGKKLRGRSKFFVTKNF